MLFHKKTILKQVRNEKSTVYGAQAIKKHIGFMARPTQDYDIISKTPRKSAKKLERSLDKQSDGNYYYTKPAIHKGTYKVGHVGMDMKKDTKDDLEVADFTKPQRKYRSVKMNGVNYVHLSEVVKDKRRALKDKSFSFRHAKDRDDLRRIRLANQLKIRWRRI